MTKAASLALPLALFFALGDVAAQTPVPLPGKNVNMVSGTTWPNGDPFLQRQNEPAIAVSTRNPLHLLAGANDYRTMDLPGLDGTVNGDAWLGLFKSFDGGLTWQSGLLPGYPQDTSPAGTASPIHRDETVSPPAGYQGATDPVVRAGTNGLFFYAGIGLDRTVTAETSQFGASAVFVARYIDNNNRPNGDPIDYIDTRIVKSSPGTVFIDKVWLAVDIPRPGAKTCAIPATVNAPAQSFAAGHVYVTFTEISGTGATQTARIMFSRSTDCGATWSLPIELSIGHQLNQGSAIAISPVTGDVYVAWRRFKTATQSHAFHIVKSSDRGRTFTTPIKIADATPFDQGTSTISMRTSGFLTIVVDLFGRVYGAWSQKGVGPYGAARIVIATSDGKVLAAVADDDDFDTKKNVGMAWSAPMAVDNPPLVPEVPITTGPGHQIMPSLTFGGGKLTLVYYALLEDHTRGVYTLGAGGLTETREAAGDLPGFPDKVFNAFIAEAVPTGVDPATGFPTFSKTLTRRHTIDVRVAQAKPADAPVFTATRLSRYRAGSRPGSGQIEQLQYNPPLLPMFGCFNDPTKCRPFFGDYIDVSPSPMFTTDPLGIWIPNVLPSKAPVFQAAWTDNRDVRPPPDGNWANWAPPTSAFLQTLGPQSLFDPTLGNRPVCVPGAVGFTQAGHRNQNIYNARITQGLYLSAKDNAKQLGGITRAFSVSLANSTEVVKSYRLTLSFGRGVEASFLQFSSLTQLDVKVAPRSSISRTVFVFSNDKRARVTVTAAEITEPGGTLVSGGLAEDLLLNPDITNPDITNPDITNAEVYDPDITNPDITNPDITNPDITNPDITNPDITNPDITNPDITNPDITNPDITNPDITNPDITNPDITNPDITNGSVTDYTWTVSNQGNTSSSYSIKLLLNGSIPPGIITQLMLHQFYLTPVAANCTLAEEPHNNLIANIRNPQFTTNPADLANPDITNPDITNATLSLAPGETAKLTLRVVDKNRFDAVTFNAATAVTPAAIAQAVNTADVAAGKTQPTVKVPPLTIATAALPAGEVGTVYNATVEASGGIGTRTWTSSPLPAGLTLTQDGLNAFITGTPQVAGSFNVTFTVTDSTTPTPQTATKTLTLNIAPRAVPQAVMTNEDTQVAITLTGEGGSPLTFAIFTNPTSGTLSGTPPNVTYTPAANFNGSDSFKFTASFGSLTSSPATVSITVVPVNDAPVAANDTATTPEDTLVSINVLANDTDVDGDTLSIAEVTTTSNTHGNVTLFPTHFTFQPDPNFFGTATFSYRAGDGNLVSNQATVTINVTPINDAPVAANDAYGTGQGTTLTVPAPGVLANDTDVDGPALQAVLVSGPASGTLTLNPNGSFTYVPGAAGTFTFTYRASDTFLQSNLATVTLTVSLANTFFTFFDTAGNDVPQAIAPAAGGGYFVAGEVSSSPSDVWIAKFNAVGNLVWQKRLGGPGNDGSATAFGGRLATVDVAALSDGGVAVAATTDSFGAGGQDAWVIRLDGAGTLVWQHTYGDSLSNAASSIAEVQPGVLAVAGSTSIGSTYDIWVLLLNDTATQQGTVISQKRFGGAADDYGAQITPLSGGGFVATGWTYSFGSAGELWVAKLDSSGDPIWFKTYGTGVFDGGSAIANVPTGGYAVAGNMGSDAWVLRLNDGGDVMWQKTFDSGGTSDIAWTIAADAFGGLFVGGLSSAGNGDPWLLGLDEATGAIRWQRIFGGGNFDQARALIVTGDGAVTFVGESGSFGFPNSGLISRLDPSGTVASCSLFVFDTSATVASPGIVIATETANLAGAATSAATGTPGFTQSDTTATESQRCPPAPDLVIDSLTSTPDDALSTDTMTFTVKVKNVGLATAGPSMALLDLGGENPGDPGTLVAVPALAFGESFTAQRQATRAAGSHLATAKADFNGEVQESNENNNQRTDAYTVLAPAPTDFTVTNTNDSGEGSLRRAIERANANAGFTDTIDFAIPGAGPHTIALASALPTITNPVIIDAPPTGACSGAAPTIEIDGVAAGAFGLVVNSAGAGTIIRGLAITRSGLAGIFLNGGGSNVIECSYLGLAPDGVTAKGNTEGILISGSTNNTIGGTSSAVRNVISANTAVGINIGAGSTGNSVLGNFIGTNAAGTVAHGNGGGGVLIEAANNAIGGLTGTPGTGAGNVISGNTGDGVKIVGPGGAAGTVIQGNIIGLNATGGAAIGNSSAGVRVHNAGVQVGGTNPGARNIVSANGISGVLVSNSGSTFNTVIQGNYIGTDITGTLDRGFATGVSVGSAPGTRVGGTAAGAGNVISGNSMGVFISNISHRALDADGASCPSPMAACYSALVQGNLIGLNAAGTGPLGNGTGISIASITPDSTAGSLVGGTVAGARNVISGNVSNGISISGMSATGNFVQGNYIGTDVSGTLDLGNGGNGLHIVDSPSNTIGAAAARNVISGNSGEGVRIDGANATGNIIQENRIGTTANGSSDLGNSASGVYVRRAPGNSVVNNVISGNDGFAGVAICGNAAFCGGGDVAGATPGSDASANVIRGNIIGRSADTVTALGNAQRGVSIDSAPNNLVGGTIPEARNVISANGLVGVVIFGPGAIRNRIVLNSIDDNTGPGIDLGADGVTANDAGDGDTGPNNLQNFPVITSAANTGSIRIQGTLNSAASTSFTLEFFANAACDPSGNGEGATFLGSTVVTTNSTGNASFDVTFAQTVPIGHFVTATATDPAGNTSEFSACFTVTSTTITFETPSLGANDRQIANPYTASGVTFTAEPGAFGDEIVGLDKNVGTATSACVPPESANQLLGTGRTGATQPQGGVGLAAFPIRATFSSALGVPVTISVDVQTLGGQTARLRLFHADGTLIGSGTSIVPSVGVCPNNDGGNRGKTTVSASATQPVGHAIVDLVGTSGIVFVIDNFTIQ